MTSQVSKVTGSRMPRDCGIGIATCRHRQRSFGMASSHLRRCATQGALRARGDGAAHGSARLRVVRGVVHELVI